MKTWPVSRFFAVKLYNYLYFILLIDFVEFTDEEGYGKYLDLHECYEKYINLKGIEVS